MSPITEETAAYTPAPGERLPNGAIIVAARQKASANLNSGWVVLAVKTTDPEYPEWVTWVCSAVDGSTFWGHYFMDFDDAYASFKER